METRIVTSYKSELDDLSFGYWFVEDNLPIESGAFIELEDAGEEDMQEAVEYLEVSPKLIEALVMFSGDIRDKTRADLIDIWKRLDRIEKALKG